MLGGLGEIHHVERLATQRHEHPTGRVAPHRFAVGGEVGVGLALVKADLVVIPGVGPVFVAHGPRLV